MIKPDHTDEDFRRKVAKLIDYAKDEIIVITGEISACGFPDLKWAAERARERGVTVKVYASKPSPDITTPYLQEASRSSSHQKSMIISWSQIQNLTFYPSPMIHIQERGRVKFTRMNGRKR